MSNFQKPQLLHQALVELTDRISRECGYAAESYVNLLRDHGALETCKIILTQPLSDDSIQLWARGHPELTIECLVSNEEWRDLFSEEEKQVATHRVTDMSTARTVVDPDTAALLAGTARSDDIAWGEELLQGIDVCSKLFEFDLSLPTKGGTAGGHWLIAHFRRHIAACMVCADKYPNVSNTILEFDRTSLRTIREVLSRCVVCDDASVNFDGFVTADGKHDFESETFVSGMKILQARVCQVSARLGAMMRAYETSYGVTSAFGLRSDNPWFRWRLSEEKSPPAE